MRKLIVAFAFLVFLLGMEVGRIVHAQTTVALQLTGNAPHTSCSVTASQTTYCFASDGLYWSNTGASYVLVAAPPPAAGVTSVTVCNAAGASCGIAQTGPVTLSIPKSVTVSAPAATLN